MYLQRYLSLEMAFVYFDNKQQVTSTEECSNI